MQRDREIAEEARPIVRGEVRKTVCVNLNWFFRLSGLTQVELAKRAGVTPAAVGSWLKGASCIGLDHVPTVCEALGISASALFGEEPGIRVPEELQELVELFVLLDDVGQAKVIDYANLLVASGLYTKRSDA